MSDRIGALTVVLKHDIRDDDAKGLIDAIMYMRGVLSVQPHVADVSDHIAQVRVRTQLLAKLMDELSPPAHEARDE